MGHVFGVAPRAGARIETVGSADTAECVDLVSPPVRGRGLKRHCRTRLPLKAERPLVAPRAGARIETGSRRYFVADFQVAPRAGARIETFDPWNAVVSKPWRESPPVRGRGLKRMSPALVVTSLE